ncbi:hypothetical protein DYB32_004211 [Aphanomyces invadans]|uniref:Nickel/cobalt efflux system n=1 Tax=Aphanomyces invadans TaxID=157072 RepID=A0A418AYD3_9STRA|nr:hypothetical protein DYB32_004211 [Aphanomyces invadans]
MGRNDLDQYNIAAIDNVTRSLLQRDRQSVTVGLFFSLGHSSVVILMSIVVVCSASTINMDTSKSIGAIVGAAVSATFLTLIGLVNGFAFIRISQQWNAARHHATPSNEEIADGDNVLAPTGLDGGILHACCPSLVGVIDQPWKMYPLGFLFGLGFDTASEVALLAISALATQSGVPSWVVLVLPGLFTCGMSLIDTLDGAQCLHMHGDRLGALTHMSRGLHAVGVWMGVHSPGEKALLQHVPHWTVIIRGTVHRSGRSVRHLGRARSRHGVGRRSHPQHQMKTLETFSDRREVSSAADVIGAMIVMVLSPAKTLDMSELEANSPSTQPLHLDDASELIHDLRKLSLSKVKALLGVSDALAKLNYDRYARQRSLHRNGAAVMLWPYVNDGAHRVIFLSRPSWPSMDRHTRGSRVPRGALLTWNSLRPIFGFSVGFMVHLSFLHASSLDECINPGTLRPLDLIQPYRLEMGQKVVTARGSDLYSFWGPAIAKDINEAFKESSSANILLNVASIEYFKSVELTALDPSVTVVDCVFKDDGQIKSVFAKRARGLMVRHVVTTRASTLAQVQAFHAEGYTFSAKESTGTQLIFNRSKAAAAEALRLTREAAAAAKKGRPKRPTQEDEPVIVTLGDVKRSTKQPRRATSGRPS